MKIIILEYTIEIISRINNFLKIEIISRINSQEVFNLGPLFRPLLGEFSALTCECVCMCVCLYVDTIQ